MKGWSANTYPWVVRASAETVTDLSIRVAVTRIAGEGSLAESNSLLHQKVFYETSLSTMLVNGGDPLADVSTAYANPSVLAEALWHPGCAGAA